MRSVPISVSRRRQLLRVLSLRPVTAGEATSADELSVAQRRVKVLSFLAGATPAMRNGGDSSVVEAFALRPDSGVEDSDDDVFGGGFGGLENGGGGAEVEGIEKAEELGGTGGVEVEERVGVEVENEGGGPEERDVGRVQSRGEAVKGEGVRVKEVAVGVDREGQEVGGVPVGVRRVSLWLERGVHVDDESLGSVGLEPERDGGGK